MRKIVRSVIAASLAVAAVTAIDVGVAHANASVDIEFTVGTGPTMTVGDTNVPMTISIKNNNTGAQNGLSNTICDEGSSAPCNAEPYGAEGITFAPSCAKLDSTCVTGDPGVFRLSATATATSSNSSNTSCEGRTFDIIQVNPALGLYHITPQTQPPVVLAQDEICTLTFSGDVINAPLVDQDPKVAGVQTGQYADVEAKVDGVTLPAFDANTDQVTINKIKPNFWTNASATVGVGGKITDTASLTGRVRPAATSTVTFSLYGPDDTTCSKAPIFTSKMTVTPANNRITSEPYMPMEAGTYNWVARYSGDRNNIAATEPCNAANETVVVTKGTPKLKTQASGPITANSGGLTDTATLSNHGKLTSTGRITFRLYGPNDAACTKLVFTDADVPVPTDGSPVKSESYSPTLPGVYRWVAEYSGDANHNGVIGECGDPSETVVVNKAKPTVVTKASGKAVVGVGQFTDTAQLSGAALTKIDGTMSFRLYGPTDPTCTGTPVFTDLDRPFKGAPITSKPYTPTAAGIYRWVVTFSGDANNDSAVGKCGDPLETTEATVNPVVLPPTGAVTNWQLLIASIVTIAGVGFVFTSRRRNYTA